jgi:hypothetical protein
MTRSLRIWTQSLPALIAAAVFVTPVGTIGPAFEDAQRPDADSLVRFETASVKRADPNEPGRVHAATSHTGRLRIVNETLGRIIRSAYGVELPHSIPLEPVSGGPDWLNSDRFTIEATAGHAVTPAETAAMRGTRLAERVKLVTRIEPRELSVLGASLNIALREQFGLQLVSTRGPVDFLIVDSASYPSDN